MRNNSVPFVDLDWQTRQIRQDLDAALRRVIDDGDFILGKDVESFETEFADFMGTRRCVGVANGTDALELALRATGVGQGDEVIVPTNSFFATAAAVFRMGATPVLVDCGDDALIDMEAAEAALTANSRAVIPVHLYGQLADMQRIRDFAHRHDLIVIEDAAQAQGAKRGSMSVGVYSEAAATSFYPGKNLGAMGDAGAVVTSDDALADRLLALRNYGSPVKYVHSSQGFNSRLDVIQAVVLRLKLRHLAEWNLLRRRAAEAYGTLLSELEDRISKPVVHDPEGHVWHLFVIQVANRDQVVKNLIEQGIGVGIHYPKPIHLQDASSSLGNGPGSMPVAERLAAESISLPMFPGIEEVQQERVVRALRTALDMSIDSGVLPRSPANRTSPQS